MPVAPHASGVGQAALVFLSRESNVEANGVQSLLCAPFLLRWFSSVSSAIRMASSLQDAQPDRPRGQNGRSGSAAPSGEAGSRAAHADRTEAIHGGSPSTNATFRILCGAPVAPVAARGIRFRHAGGAPISGSPTNANPGYEGAATLQFGCASAEMLLYWLAVRSDRPGGLPVQRPRPLQLAV